MTTSTSLESSGWSFRRIKLVHLAYALLALPIVAVILFATIQPIQVLPRISLAPGFSFIDQDGQRLTNEDLRGSLVLYNFTYTGCDEDCPATGAFMAEVQKMAAGLDTGGIPFEQVTIFFDPENDSPERLRAYAEAYGADTATWHFVTGDPVRLKNVIGGGFSAYYNEREDGSFQFDPSFVLVDGWGIIRTKYKTRTPDLATVERDITMITTEAQNSEGASRVAYEAAHLFLCYPD